MIAGAWIGALAVVVAAGLAGPDDTAEPVASPAAVVPSPASATAQGRAVDPGSGDVAALEVTVPGIAGVPITRGEIVVRGLVSPDTGRIQVLLQTRGATPVVVALVHPAPAAEAPHRVESSTFHAVLGIPDPRPIGPAVLQVVSYDESGRARDSLLRSIVIGELATWPIGGEDGLMGGIVVGAD